MGRLQNAVQQLKSKNQPILDNADRSLGLLSLNEAKATASTLFEGVIADCANASTNKTTFQKEILKQ